MIPIIIGSVLLGNATSSGVGYGAFLIATVIYYRLLDILNKDSQ